MTALRLISLSAHAALELVAGVVVMASPFVLDFAPGPAVMAVAFGALIVGLALNSTGDEGRGVPIAAHFAFDRVLVLGLAIAAVAVAAAGYAGAAVFFAAAGMAMLALSVATRYSAPT